MGVIMTGTKIAIALTIILAAGQFFLAPTSAQILLEDDMTDGSSWTILDAGDSQATFGYDYSLDGIPEAPNSVGGAARSGLKMEANLTQGLGTQILAVPNGFNLSGNYRIQVDIWQNYDILSDAATEFLGVHVGHDGVTADQVGGGFLYTGDGGSSRDYRGYKAGDELFVEGGYYAPPLGDLGSETDPRSNNNESPELMTAFPAFDIGLALEPDDAQGPNQVGLAAEGAGGFQWMTVELTVDEQGLPGGGVGLGTAEIRMTSAQSGNTVLIGTVDNNRGDVTSLAGSPALFYADFFSSLAELPELNFGVFDNFIIEQLGGGGMPDGDFDDNGLYECADVDALVAEIVSVKGGNAPNLAFDLDGDNDVTNTDLDAWLAEAGDVGGLTTSGDPVLVGDADLNGAVDGADFIAWNGAKFTAVAAWCQGDFNADGFVDGTDFILWNNNKFTSADAVSVPEPSSVALLILGLVAIVRRNRK